MTIKIEAAQRILAASAHDLEKKISKLFNGATVTNVVVDHEFGNVSATVNGRKNVDCGFIEDYK